MFQQVLVPLLILIRNISGNLRLSKDERKGAWLALKLFRQSVKLIPDCPAEFLSGINFYINIWFGTRCCWTWPEYHFQKGLVASYLYTCTCFLIFNFDLVVFCTCTKSFQAAAENSLITFQVFSENNFISFYFCQFANSTSLACNVEWLFNYNARTNWLFVNYK